MSFLQKPISGENQTENQTEISITTSIVHSTISVEVGRNKSALIILGQIQRSYNRQKTSSTSTLRTKLCNKLTVTENKLNSTH